MGHYHSHPEVSCAWATWRVSFKSERRLPERLRVLRKVMKETDEPRTLEILLLWAYRT